MGIKILSKNIKGRIDLTLEGAIKELATLCMTESCDNWVVVCNAIPAPRDSVKRLLDDAKVALSECFTLQKGLL